MLITYVYRIKPSSEQEAIMLHTLELLRRHWNYALGQRLDWLRRTRCQIDRCSIDCEPLGEIPKKSKLLYSASSIKRNKKTFPRI